MYHYNLTDEELNDLIKDAVRKQRRNLAPPQSRGRLTTYAGNPPPDATPRYRAAFTLGERCLYLTPGRRTAPRPSRAWLAGKPQDVLA